MSGQKGDWFGKHGTNDPERSWKEKKRQSSPLEEGEKIRAAEMPGTKNSTSQER